MRASLLATALVLVAAGCAIEPEPTPGTDPAPLASLSLANDGFGDVQFGQDPESVIASITDRFGGPDLDTNWIPSTSNEFGSCPGEAMRAIGWGSLVAIFVDDGNTDLGGWFFTYTYGYDYAENMGGIDPRGLDLVTTDGIGLGSTVAELQTAFGDGFVISGDEELDVWSFSADTSGFRGLLSGGDPAATVTLIAPLEGCDE